MKKKSACILLVFAAVIVLTYMTGESYYRGISEKAESVRGQKAAVR